MREELRTEVARLVDRAARARRLARLASGARHRARLERVADALREAAADAAARLGQFLEEGAEPQGTEPLRRAA